MDFDTIVENAFYLLALLNPASKVMFLASCNPRLTRQENTELTWKSSLAALAILGILAAAGNFIFKNIFRVELYSLQITGGVIVFMIGFNAVQQGRFTAKQQENIRQNITDISLVPLAAPLIAGPGTIAAAISLCVQHGWFSVMMSLLISIAVNFALMLFAVPISNVLDRTHISGPLIRLTGLIIAAVAIQMVLSGVGSFVRTLRLG